MTSTIDTIERCFEARTSLSQSELAEQAQEAILSTIASLDDGSLRVAEKIKGDWVVNEWVKKAVLLYFKLSNNAVMSAGSSHAYDKVPSKFANANTPEFWEAMQTRVVPPAAIRRGAFLGKNTVIMPSFINIGAYVDEGTLIDTWATVGSCAQIGKHVHLSGGAGIGGVLEPLQAKPTIIEDNCFIGARSEIAEGVIVEQGAVISMGVYIGQSTPIYNRLTQETEYGRVPTNSVVVPGALPAKDGSHSRYCALIVKTVDDRTRSKTTLNELLRDIET